MLCGCSSVKDNPNNQYAASHFYVDNSISDVRKVQQKAASQVYSIEKSVSDPIIKSQVEDLKKTISDLGLKLEIATGNISWYESQYDVVLKQKDDWEKKDKKDQDLRFQAEKERDALVWIFAVCCGVTAISAFKPVLSTINGWKQLLFIAASFAAGFSLGFTIGRWCLRFLSQFTPHLPF